MQGEDVSTDEDLLRFETPDDAFAYLRHAGTLDDADIDLGETALALALVFLPGVHIGRFRHHLEKLAHQADEEFQSRLRLKEGDTLELRLRVLQKILHEAHGYKGDTETYDDLQNASFIRMIERRRGLPVALGLLYILLARKLGWEAEGLNFPGHFVVRLEKDGHRMLIDPFNGGAELQAADLRRFLKTVAGQKAELSHDYYKPVSNRDMLLRLENNLKSRLIENEDYAQAIIVIEAMEALAPGDHRILFDKAVIYVKLGQVNQGAAALEQYIERVPTPRDRDAARMLLAEIRTLLH
jgi:regulator of sirC expression with transglutaminase-like and TPR domain